MNFLVRGLSKLVTAKDSSLMEGENLKEMLTSMATSLYLTWIEFTFIKIMNQLIIDIYKQISIFRWKYLDSCETD